MPSVLQSMGLQWVGQDWAMEKQQMENNNGKTTKKDTKEGSKRKLTQISFFNPDEELGGQAEGKKNKVAW